MPLVRRQQARARQLAAEAPAAPGRAVAGGGEGGAGEGEEAAAEAALMQARDTQYGSGLFRLFAGSVDDSLTWEFLPWLRTVTKLPVFVKVGPGPAGLGCAGPGAVSMGAGRNQLCRHIPAAAALSAPALLTSTP
jgi:hypothetical protein